MIISYAGLHVGARPPDWGDDAILRDYPRDRAQTLVSVGPYRFR